MPRSPSPEEDGLPLLIKVKEHNDKLSTPFLASIIASLAALNFGYALGYTSPTQSEMTAKNDPLDKDQFSWFSVIHFNRYLFFRSFALAVCPRRFVIKDTFLKEYSDDCRYWRYNS